MACICVSALLYMVCHLSSAKPLPNTVLIYYQLKLLETHLSDMLIKIPKHYTKNIFTTSYAKWLTYFQLQEKLTQKLNITAIKASW